MYQMDAIDYAILEILKDDGRCTYSDIAEQVNLSRVAVRERIAAMKRKALFMDSQWSLMQKPISGWHRCLWM